jgi:hypothetical protein
MVKIVRPADDLVASSKTKVPMTGTPATLPAGVRISKAQAEIVSLTWPFSGGAAGNRTRSRNRSDLWKSESDHANWRGST